MPASCKQNSMCAPTRYKWMLLIITCSNYSDQLPSLAGSLQLGTSRSFSICFSLTQIGQRRLPRKPLSLLFSLDRRRFRYIQFWPAFHHSAWWLSQNGLTQADKEVQSPSFVGQCHQISIWQHWTAASLWCKISNSTLTKSWNSDKPIQKRITRD